MKELSGLGRPEGPPGPVGARRKLLVTGWILCLHVLVTDQGLGLRAPPPFSRAWALCVTPVLLGDPLGP